MIGWLIILQLTIVAGYFIYKKFKADAWGDSLDFGDWVIVILSIITSSLILALIGAILSTLLSVAPFVQTEEQVTLDVPHIDEALVTHAMFYPEEDIKFIDENGVAYSVDSNKANIIWEGDLETPYVTYTKYGQDSKVYDWLSTLGQETYYDNFTLYLPEE